jgi:hypothetical protein
MIVNSSLNSFQNWNQSTEKGGLQNDLPRLMTGYSFGFRSGGGGIIGNEDAQKRTLVSVLFVWVFSWRST